MMHLLHALPPLRDQGERETCLSLAVTDGHYIIRGSGPVLAADFLHHQATLLAGVGINDAVHTVAAISALGAHGQPAETECPYSLLRRPSSWVPDSPKGSVWKRRANQLHADIWSTVCAEITARKAAVVILDIDDAFWTPSAGIVDSALGPPRASHAVLAVGLNAEPPRLLIRNSWGHEWGLEGYAWLSQSYLAARCTAVISFGDEAT